MSLPLSKKYKPMEALPASELPTGPEWQYEPKWDGFRCLAFRDGKRVELMSKSGKPLTRYFPELVRTLSGLPAEQFVLDGEIVIPVDGTLSFDAVGSSGADAGSGGRAGEGEGIGGGYGGVQLFTLVAQHHGADREIFLLRSEIGHHKLSFVRAHFPSFIFSR